MNSHIFFSCVNCHNPNFLLNELLKLTLYLYVDVTLLFFHLQPNSHHVCVGKLRFFPLYTRHDWAYGNKKGDTTSIVATFTFIYCIAHNYLLVCHFFLHRLYFCAQVQIKLIKFLKNETYENCHFFPFRQSPHLFMWLDMVPEFVAWTEKSRRRNDTEETPNVHHAKRTSGVLCPKYATRSHELLKIATQFIE